jgi:hypothetical protein
MGDSILNFSDLGSDEYVGLSDTASGFSGSSTFQDVQLGSPIPLDTSLGPSATATSDFMGVQPITSDVPNQIQLSTAVSSQALSGNSDPGFSPTYVGDTFNVSSLPPQNTQASPTPNASAMNANSAAGISALSKFGASFAQLLAGPSTTHAGAVAQTTTAGGAPLQPGGTSSTTTLLLVVVVGALILLLLRSD